MERTLDTIQVQRRQFILCVINRWLVTGTCSLPPPPSLARAGYYQPSGAFASRSPADSWRCCLRGRARQIARGPAAGRHFVEGDVQHWWHERAAPAFAPFFRRSPWALCGAEYVLTTRRWACSTSRAVPRGPLPRRTLTRRTALPGRILQHGTALRHGVRAIDKGSPPEPTSPLMGRRWNDGPCLFVAREKEEHMAGLLSRTTC